MVETGDVGVGPTRSLSTEGCGRGGEVIAGGGAILTGGAWHRVCVMVSLRDEAAESNIVYGC